MSDEKVQKITKITEGIEETTETKQRVVPDKDHFDALMKQSTDVSKVKVEDQGTEEVAKQNTLMDEVRDANQSRTYPTLSPESLVAQTQEVISKIDDLKRDLSTPNLEIKDSVQNLLKNKLEHIDENLKIALEKVGKSEYEPPGELANLGSPIERFIGFLSHSQHHLDKVAEDVRTMHLNSETITPAAMLAVQIKVSYVQQELEFFTSLLNKALESTKTIMNVQV